MFFDLLSKLQTMLSPRQDPEPSAPAYEFCPRCEANLTLQKGYSNTLPYWVCLGCGEMLINPELESESGILWQCDNCEAVLNVQKGFSEGCGEWQCTECGYPNKISSRELYRTVDEYEADLRNPFKGLSNKDLLEVSAYQTEEQINGREDIAVVRDPDTGRRYIRKFLTTYEKSIYEHIMAHPIPNMPRIEALYESANCLIVIESYIAGETVEELLANGPLPEKQGLFIAREVCRILENLHGQPVSIVHRDIKPANIIITPENAVFLLDMNVAKWYDPDETDDTRYLGTQYYAAPAQVGYGLSASSVKADIYACGMLLNVMLTGAFPKEKKAEGQAWSIIERCIRLNADERFTAEELRKELEQLQ